MIFFRAVNIPLDDVGRARWLNRKNLSAAIYYTSMWNFDTNRSLLFLSPSSIPKEIIS